MVYYLLAMVLNFELFQMRINLKRKINIQIVAFRRFTWMVYMDGLHGWFTWMVYMDGLHGWFTWMVYMDGLHGWFTTIITFEVVFVFFCRFLINTYINK